MGNVDTQRAMCTLLDACRLVCLPVMAIGETARAIALALRRGDDDAVYDTESISIGADWLAYASARSTLSAALLSAGTRYRRGWAMPGGYGAHDIWDMHGIRVCVHAMSPWGRHHVAHFAYTDHGSPVAHVLARYPSRTYRLGGHELAIPQDLAAYCAAYYGLMWAWAEDAHPCARVCAGVTVAPQHDPLA